GYQRKQLASALQSADGDVTVLTGALSRIIGEDYDRVLRVETNSLRDRYRRTIQDDQSRNPTTQLLLQDRWRDDLEKLEEKRLAARDYQQILAKIRDGHKQLATQAGHWTARELVRDITPYTTSIVGLTRDFKAAFR